MTATWAGLAIETELLTDYGYRDTVVFAGENWPRYLGYIAAGLAQQLADFSTYGDGLGAVLAVANNGFVSSSATPAAIGLGAKTFTTGINLALRPGMTAQAFSTADPSQWMLGAVTAYDPAGGLLSLQVTAAGGAGTFNDWTVALSGVQGTRGVQGDPGVQGIQGPGGSGSTISAQQNGVPVTTLARGNINTRFSLVSTDNAGANAIDIALAGDVASPGAGKVYGTDNNGARGWLTPAPDPLYVLGLTF